VVYASVECGVRATSAAHVRTMHGGAVNFHATDCHFLVITANCMKQKSHCS